MSFKFEHLPIQPRDERSSDLFNWAMAFMLLAVVGAILFLVLLIAHRWWLAFFTWIIENISALIAKYHYDEARRHD